jgi:hypothetical protein
MGVKLTRLRRDYGTTFIKKGHYRKMYRDSDKDSGKRRTRRKARTGKSLVIRMRVKAKSSL